jgi:hypothetical protein
MINREPEYSYYSEELRKGWKEPQCNGLWSVEVDLLKWIEGKGWRWWKIRLFAVVAVWIILS